MEKEFLNKKVIVRSYGAGVFFGTLAEKDGTEVKLTDCRRLWYWAGAASLSEVAVSGVKEPNRCKFSVVVPSIIVTGVLEVIPCTDAAIANIEEVAVWRA